MWGGAGRGAAHWRTAETQRELALALCSHQSAGFYRNPPSEAPSSSKGLSHVTCRPHQHPNAESQGPSCWATQPPRAQLQDDTCHSAAFVLKSGRGVGPGGVSPPDGVAWLRVQVPQGRKFEEWKSGSYSQVSSSSSSTEH